LAAFLSPEPGLARTLLPPPQQVERPPTNSCQGARFGIDGVVCYVTTPASIIRPNRRHKFLPFSNPIEVSRNCQLERHPSEPHRARRRASPRADASYPNFGWKIYADGRSVPTLSAERALGNAARIANSSKQLENQHPGLLASTTERPASSEAQKTSSEAQRSRAQGEVEEGHYQEYTTNPRLSPAFELPSLLQQAENKQGRGGWAYLFAPVTGSNG